MCRNDNGWCVIGAFLMHVSAGFGYTIVFSKGIAKEFFARAASETDPL